jgi:uncharacterized protein involved in response to NO
MMGAAVWPLHFAGLLEFYPGQTHTRLMTYGFFGGFIVGFLGTALPRMVSAAPLRPIEAAVLLLNYALMLGMAVAGKLIAADASFVLLLLIFGSLLAWRLKQRRDVPPPSFVLVALGLLCAGVGACLAIWTSYNEDAFYSGALQHLLAYQGFMLLPILGVGAFLLPRFFGAKTGQDFPESRVPPPGWTTKALIAAGVGVLIIGSFVVEVAGWSRAGPALRLLVTAWYLVREVPFYRAEAQGGAPTQVLKLALALLLTGFGATTLLPAYRVSLLHLTLVGGFTLTTLTVATRVIYGHSGKAELLARPGRWFWMMAGLMLLGMTTRISGDFLPKALASHYSYGALLWILGLLLWAFYVLPLVLVRDPEAE